jgi:hypothetical protein
MTSNTHRDVVKAIATALAAHQRAGVCADGPDCLWCPAEAIATALVDAQLVEVDR